MSTYHLGIDLGGTNLRCAVFDENDRALSRVSRPTNAQLGVDSVIDAMVEAMHDAAREAGTDLHSVDSAGIGVPSPTDPRQGLVYHAPNMPGWNHIPLGKILRKKTGLAVIIENDANCAGWGEFVAGAGVGCKSMVMITLGTGIGGALILGGALHTGRDGAAGEIGHMCIQYGGRACGCGGRGCVEAYASATSVVKRFREAVASGRPSSLAAKEEVSCRDIFVAAGEGDACAGEIVDETAKYLGVLCSSLAEILNPERCIFAGGMIQAGESFIGKIRGTCLGWNRHPSRTVEIFAAKLDQEAGLVGAARLAKDLARRNVAHHIPG